MGHRLVRRRGVSWGTSAAALEAETSAFRSLLARLAAESRLASARGHILLASSAGGVYGGSRVWPDHGAHATRTHFTIRPSQASAGGDFGFLGS